MTAMISDSSPAAPGEGKPPARSARERISGGTRDIVARPRPGQGDWPAAAVLMPFHDLAGACRIWMAAAFMLGAIPRDTLSDLDAAGRAPQRALDLTEPDQVLSLCLIHPPLGLLDRHARQHSADAALICQTADLLARLDRLVPPLGKPTHHVEALSCSEVQVLRYLQPNLSVPEIAGELSISVNTVETHQRHVYQKLGARSRTQTVEQARALDLLASPAPATNTESQRYEFQL